MIRPRSSNTPTAVPTSGSGSGTLTRPGVTMWPAFNPMPRRAAVDAAAVSAHHDAYLADAFAHG